MHPRESGSEQGVDREPAIEPSDGWTTEVSSGYALAGFLALVFIGFTLLAAGPLMGLDAFFNLRQPPHVLVPALHVLDQIGRRAVCLPVVTVFTLWGCWRRRSWRACWVVAISVFLETSVVGALKIGLGRAEPVTGNPHFFSGGMAYPSGHTANIVLVYGLVAYLLSRYVRVTRRWVWVTWVLVCLLSVVMVGTSLTLNWHWFADLIGGLLIGGVMLQLTVTVDAAVPQAAFRTGWREGVRMTIDGILRRPEPAAPLEPGAAASPEEADGSRPGADTPSESAPGRETVPAEQPSRHSAR